MITGIEKHSKESKWGAFSFFRHDNMGIQKVLNTTCVVILIIGIFSYAQETGGAKMKIKSPAFENNKMIPSDYTCDGRDVNPALSLEDLPANAKSLALIVDDPDAPGGMWVHWVVFDIPITSAIKENSIPGKQGINDFRKQNYGGPCPPFGTHRYFFKIYALDKELGLNEDVSKKDLEKAMLGHVLSKAELIGLYKRKASY
jgi:Raf kinase inhibitor-like YbhB/YbcL family protein